MRILLLEENVVDADLARRILASTIAGCVVDIAPTLQKARELIFGSEQDYTIALLDMRLPDGNGMDLLMEIRQTGREMAVVMLTGSGNEDVAVAALKAGADEYVVKKGNYIDRLPGVVEYAIESHKKIVVQRSEIIHVLYIECNTADEELTRRHLQEYAPQIHLKVVATGEEALTLLEKGSISKNSIDAILLD